MPRKAGETKRKNGEIEEKLLHNLVELQKVHASLAEKFDSLSKQISSLLNLFETTARTFASNPMNQVSEKDREFLDKVDKLLEQNKTIAKGLTMVEERIRDRAVTKPDTAAADEPREPSQLNPRPLPRF